MKKVRLDLPDLQDRLQTVYSEYVSDDLLSAWMQDLLQAPGQTTSSPWPERIEIESVDVADGIFEVAGRIVEITSWELTHGGAANEIRIRMTAERREGRWLMTEFRHLPRD